MLYHPLYKKRIKLGINNDYPFDETCAADEKKYALFSTDRFYLIYKSKCDLQQIGEKVSTVDYAGRVRKGFPHKRSFDIG